MTGSETGRDIRRSVPQGHRPGLTVLGVLAAMMLAATVYLVAPGAHTAVRDVR